MSNNQHSPDSVTVAFEIMDKELEIEIERLNSEGANAFQQSLHEQAGKLSKKGVSLREFRNKVQRLADEWKESFSQEFPEPSSTQHIEQNIRQIESHSKGSKTGMLVKFRDGTIVCERTAAQTLVETLRTIGFERVAGLKIRINRTHLVSKNTPPDRYNAQLVDGFFIMTHSSTAQKMKHLEDISGKLQLGLSIHLVE